MRIKMPANEYKSMEGIIVERTTLWDILTDSSYLVIHLPRFALFLMFAIPLLMYCDKKRNFPTCTFATAFLMVCTGVFGIAGIYYFKTVHIYPGYRFPIPIEYYLLTWSILIFSASMFLMGLMKDFRRNTKPLILCRVLIFLITAGFSMIAISSPLKINKQLDAREKEQRQALPAVQTP